MSFTALLLTGADTCACCIYCAECWISPHPYLLMTYLAQYMPVTWNFMNRWIGSMRIKAYKAGVETMSFSGIWAHLRGTDKAAPAAATKKEL